MKKIALLVLSLYLALPLLNAQTDSLLLLLGDEPKMGIGLLPERMTLTQKALWGERGMFRITGLAPLTERERERELKIRRTMLITHQVTGYTTALAMLAQGIVGQQLYNGKHELSGLHEALATGIYAGYFTTAGLALFTPPPLVRDRDRGITSIKLHKVLAYIHFSGMIATILLAEKAEEDARYKPYHRAAAYTTFGAFAGAMIVMRF